MTIYKGKGVNKATAVGKIAVLTRQEAVVKRERTDCPDSELERLERAKAEAETQLREIAEKVRKEAGSADAEIFEIHMMMLEDEDYNNAIKEMITAQMVNAEYAVAVTGDNFAQMFADMDDAYMQARSADVKDVTNRIIACLTESTSAFDVLREPAVIVADDLSPAETASLDKEKVLAFVTAKGSVNSHTAILARSMDIPAVIGAGEELLSAVRDGDTVAVDGFTGEVILNPDEETVENMEKKLAEQKEKTRLLQSLKGKASVTADGKKISICANIGSVDNMGEVLVNDAEGIGLFRSEFLYLEKNDFPTEQEQFAVYRRVLESMGGKKVIIRTLDIGADKQCGYFNLKKEENPALGIRGTRLCLNRPEIFKVQLRALLRASAYGNMGIMFPMISNVWELEEILRLINGIKAELDDEGIPYSDKIEIGIMIETPASALISHRLAPMVDFFSVGTNDLTQYTLACDRQNPDAERFCDTHHEAVLSLVKTACENAHRYGKWIGICGELAADTSLTEYFLRLGIDELSVAPAFVLRLREVVRGIDLNGSSSAEQSPFPHL